MTNLATYTPPRTSNIEYFIKYANTQERMKAIIVVTVVVTVIVYVLLVIVSNVFRKINDRRKEKEYVSKFECKRKRKGS